MKTLILASLLALTAMSGIVAAAPRPLPPGGCGKFAICAPAPPPNQGDKRVNHGKPIGWVFR